MKQAVQHIIAMGIAVALFAALLFSGVLYAEDMYLCDAAYEKLEAQTRDIRMIVIDEKTEAAYGKFENWSREKSAELAELLSADPDTAPAVLAFDIMFIGASGEEADARLAEACRKAGEVFPVVGASNLVFRGVTETAADGAQYYNAAAIETVEMPYGALRDVISTGFANACISRDNIIRTAMFHAEAGGAVVDSFPYTAYRLYAQQKGLAVQDPAPRPGRQIGFFYSGESGDIAHVSLVDVLEGRIPLTEFRDTLVLVGTYAAGFQDDYSTAVEGGSQMYGVEINANIVRALLLGKTATQVATPLYALIAAAVLFLMGLLLSRTRLWVAVPSCAALIAAHVGLGRWLALRGHLIPQIYFIVAVLLMIAYFIVAKYIIEKIRRRQTMQTLKRYVAPQIVDKLSKDGTFELKLGGEKRHIAVLFVDVRGFTTMSEALTPEEVVGILNEYLSVTTDAIFRNEGTLDKFVGDAAMAVFNAPFSLDDYIFKAVKTAWDIQQGVNALGDRLEAQFGRRINVGVGVNCGEAVVGNIGSDIRMDYTAIGDTVNTAARLESNAPAGQVLISRAVYDAVSERVEAEPMGELALKGKAEKVPVYRVRGFLTDRGEENTV